MMRSLVTGGTGFIGSHLVDRLIEANYNVLVPVRKESNLGFLPSKGVEIVEADLLNLEGVKELTKEIDIVFHLASIRGSGWSFDNEKVFKINVDITDNLLRASVQNSVKNFVYVSSVSVFGHPEGGPIDEDYACSPVTRYGSTKYRSERLVEAYHSKEGLSTTIIRPVITYGPRDTWGMIPKLINLIDSKRYLTVGSGENRVHLIYIDDLIDGLMLAVSNHVADGKTYILAGEEPITINRLVEIISSLLNKDVPSFNIPLWFAKTTGYLMETLYRVCSIKKEPLVTLDKLDIMCRDRMFDQGRAKKEIRFIPRIDYEEGLKQTVRWLKNVEMSCSQNRAYKMRSVNSLI